MNLPQTTAETWILLVGWPGRGRDALAELVRTEAGLLAIDCADSGLLAMKTAREHNLRSVIITNSLPDLEVLELVRQMKQHFPGTPCLVLADRTEVQRDALLAGADAVMPSGSPWGQLLPVVQKLLIS